MRRLPITAQHLMALISSPECLSFSVFVSSDGPVVAEVGGLRFEVEEMSKTERKKLLRQLKKTPRQIKL